MTLFCLRSSLQECDPTYVPVSINLAKWNSTEQRNENVCFVIWPTNKTKINVIYCWIAKRLALCFFSFCITVSCTKTTFQTKDQKCLVQVTNLFLENIYISLNSWALWHQHKSYKLFIYIYQSCLSITTKWWVTRILKTNQWNILWFLVKKQLREKQHSCTL